MDHESKECKACGCTVHPKAITSICYDDGGGMECLDIDIIPAKDICRDCEIDHIKTAEADFQVDLNNFEPSQDESDLPF